MSCRSKSLVLAVAVAACFAAPGAYAQPGSVQEIVVHAHLADAETHSQIVSYADLDLGHQAGARALLQRINGAAKLVCGPEPVFRENPQPYKACTQQAVYQAVADVDNPKVSALLHNRH